MGPSSNVECMAKLGHGAVATAKSSGKEEDPACGDLSGDKRSNSCNISTLLKTVKAFRGRENPARRDGAASVSKPARQVRTNEL